MRRSLWVRRWPAPGGSHVRHWFLSYNSQDLKLVETLARLIQEGLYFRLASVA